MGRYNKDRDRSLESWNCLSQGHRTIRYVSLSDSWFCDAIMIQYITIIRNSQVRSPIQIADIINKVCWCLFDFFFNFGKFLSNDFPVTFFPLKFMESEQETFCHAVYLIVRVIDLKTFWLLITAHFLTINCHNVIVMINLTTRAKRFSLNKNCV